MARQGAAQFPRRAAGRRWSATPGAGAAGLGLPGPRLGLAQETSCCLTRDVVFNVLLVMRPAARLTLDFPKVNRTLPSERGRGAADASAARRRCSRGLYC